MLEKIKPWKNTIFNYHPYMHWIFIILALYTQIIYQKTATTPNDNYHIIRWYKFAEAWWKDNKGWVGVKSWSKGGCGCHLPCKKKVYPLYKKLLLGGCLGSLLRYISLLSTLIHLSLALSPANPLVLPSFDAAPYHSYTHNWLCLSATDMCPSHATFPLNLPGNWLMWVGVVYSQLEMKEG